MTISRVTRVGAYALTLDHEQRILLCRIAPGIWSGVGSWTLPGGGVDYGETPADAAIRELGEETGLIGRIDRVAGVDSVTGRWTRGDGVVEDFHGIRIVYRVAITGGELRDEPHGSTDTCGWVTRDEAASLPLVDLAHYGLRLAYEED